MNYYFNIINITIIIATVIRVISSNWYYREY